MTALHLQQTWPLWLALGAPLVLLAFRGQSATGGHLAWRAQAALRTAAFLCLALALCEPVMEQPTSAVAVMHAFDVSRGVPAERIAASVRASRATGTIDGAVLFAERAQSVTSAEALAVALAAPAGNGTDLFGRGGTDLALALETAAAGMPETACRHVVLASDGRHTEGDVWATVERLRDARIRVHTLAAEFRAADHVAIVRADVVERPPAGRPVPVEVLVRATAAARARLGLAVGDRAPDWTAVELPAGDSRWRLSVTFPQAGVTSLSVHLKAEGEDPRDADPWRADVVVGRRQAVLQLAADADAGRGLGATLMRQGFDVTTTTPASVAKRPAQLDRFDAVILHDPARDAFPAALELELDRFVREGGGLVFVAGEHSHGRDAWSGSPLERLLPVRFEGPRRKDEADLLFLIDRSYSMRGPRLEIAKTAVATAIESLEDRHRAGVVAFDARPRELVPMLRKAVARAQLGRVGGLTAAGQTNVFDALWDAYLRLRDSRAETRHVILLSDGNTAPTGRRTPLPGDVQTADAPPDSFEVLGEKLAAARISVSTVAIGDDPDFAFMQVLAQWTGGRAHAAARPEHVPALFADEARRLAGDALVERPFRPRVLFEADAVAGVDFARAPPLQGLVVTRARPHADRVLDGVGGYPLLVTHRHGLGVVTAFLSDASGRWSSAWREWHGFGRFWAQTVRAAAREGPRDASRLDLTRDGDDLAVTLETEVDAPGYAPMASLSEPGGRTDRLALDRTAPGRYTGRLARAGHAPGSYRVEVAPGGGVPEGLRRAVGVAALRVETPTPIPAGAEDRARLRLIVERTGGRFGADPSTFVPSCEDPPVRKVPLWRLLCAAALLAYVAELAVRRLGRG